MSVIDTLRRVARYCAPLPIIAIIVLSLVPGDERPHTGLLGQVEHVLAYALTAAGLVFAFPRRSALIVGAMAALAAFLELGQTWVPGRTSQLIDFGASSGGALCGIALGGLANLVMSRLLPNSACVGHSSGLHWVRRHEVGDRIMIARRDGASRRRFDG